ncbi:uncharacterized protein [Chironomus tepperi]|uniref:uncharacterized protein n=1 Tax=Chironomus tepperi TaxID=113505 RepID=UPI00391F06EA
MQAKIIDYASDRLVNALHKIDKKDVKKVMTNVSNKVQSKNSQAPLNPPLDRVTSSDEYCAMLRNEFDFIPPSYSDRQRGILKNKNYDTKFSVEGSVVDSVYRDENYEEGNKSNLDSISNNVENFEEPMKIAEATKQYQSEVQSFVQKKNVAQGMMDLALLSSNCNQLRYVLDMNYMHPYYSTSLALIGTSLALQIIVGLALLYSNGYNLKRQSHMNAATRISNLSIVGVFIITVINVLIAAFNGTNLPIIPPPAIKNITEPMMDAVADVPIVMQDGAV